ncbi:hypothetical protein [Salisaeta longa]|uniref:hypothetical protein n=1 Tax=Salisaeta longa TaxID=503170 RepID=UPI0003B43724|nr:hypothetical protein [Salisaeta longa]
MNVERLESVRQAIVHFPSRFCAGQWAFARNARAVLAHHARPEGFKCCIAGHALLQTDAFSERRLLKAGGFHTGGCLWNAAARALDLTPPQARELFFPSQWDKPYKQDYYLCGKDEEASIAGSYIDYFIGKHAPKARPAPSEAAASVQDVARVAA